MDASKFLQMMLNTSYRGVKNTPQNSAACVLPSNPSLISYNTEGNYSAVDSRTSPHQYRGSATSKLYMIKLSPSPIWVFGPSTVLEQSFSASRFPFSCYLPRAS
ncbi:hypothetical protein RRG08_066610 [Elysia crispata]|uniref:Uncharacterized protein n=1 Tax=Elysia crispata TaxID=231223 RepID=A0AAE1D7U2_9GAST|nr:hypothetical protein RRG08_066610 [Elysia crispata]